LIFKRILYVVCYRYVACFTKKKTHNLMEKSSRMGRPRIPAGTPWALKRVNLKNGLKITPKTSIPQWYGDKMDHAMAVDMLLANE